MRFFAAAALALAAAPLSAAGVRTEAPAAVPLVLGAPAGLSAVSSPRWEAPAVGFSPLAGLALDRPLPALAFPAAAPLFAPRERPAAPAAAPRAAPVAAAAPSAAVDPSAGRSQLGEASGLGEAARASFDGERASREPGAVAGGDGESKEPPLGRRTPRKPANGFLLRATAAAALSAAAVYPQLMNERPAMFLAFALALAWGSALSLEFAWGAYRLGRRLLAGKDDSEPSPSRWVRGLKGLGAAGVGLGLGTALGLIPAHFSGLAIQAGSAYYAPEADARVLGSEFARVLAGAIRDNPEGREILKALEDRRGTVRLPAVFIARGVGAPLRYVAVLDALFIDASAVESRGWNLSDFELFEANQALLARELRAEGARELYRAGQARRSVLQMHAEEQGLSGGLMEAEYEAALAKQRFVHASLREDPSAPLTAADLAEYEAMLDDLRGALRRLDSLPRYRGYSHQRDPYYTHRLLSAEFANPELAVEGYRLLSRRAESAEERDRYLAKARRREKDEGFRWDWEPRGAPR